MRSGSLRLMSVALGMFLLVVGGVSATDCNPCDENDDFDSTLDGAGTTDVDIRDIYPGTVNPPIALAMVNGAEKAYFDSYCSGSYAGIDCTDACSESFSSSTGQFGPEVGDCYITRQGDGPAGATRYGKFIINDRTYNGNNSFYDLSYHSLGACSCGAPPTANFTYSTYDLIGFFTDTSTESPTSWSWAFGGTGSSSSQNPQHYFGTANSYSVTLTATNASGSDGETKSVSVSQEPSSTVTTGSPLDLNGDGTNDLSISNAPAGCGGRAALDVINNATWAGASEDYRTIDAGDIPASISGTSLFCIGTGTTGLTEPAFIQTDTALPTYGTYKIWTPDNSGTSVRVIFEALSTTLPDPPVTSWIFSTYDLIAFFTDTSTNNPGSWSWEFGDGNTSSAQHPDHFYAAAAMRSVCMTPSNLGGSGSEVCKTVTTGEQPGTTGTTVDFDMDGTNDLTSFYPGACGSRRALRVVGAVKHGSPDGETDYRFVDSSHVSGPINSAVDFCTSIGVAGLNDTRLAVASSGEIFKFWTPENTSSSIRFEYEKVGTACSSSSEHVDVTLSGTDTLIGCTDLMTGANVTVASGADAGIFGGSSVGIGDGLTVQTNGQLTVGECGHNICKTSATPLVSGCNPCVTEICAGDGFCCNTSWDGPCVDQVVTVCDLVCW